MMYNLKRVLLVGIATVTTLLTTTEAYSHSGPDNTGAVMSCEMKKRSQSCQYTDGHNNLYIGFCRYRYLSGDDLLCVRTEPIRKADPTKEEADTEHQHNEKTSPK